MPTEGRFTTMQQEPPGGPERDVLWREEAAQRSFTVSGVSYQLEFDLSAGRATYRGRTTIEFDLDVDAVGGAPLFLDFSGRVLSLWVNGREVTPDHHGHRLWLALGTMAAHNTIVVEYRNTFDASGDGFHRFVDPEDGSEYLYSNLEPFMAHRLFPCFDQPDIKAIFALSVVAPSAWRVISAEQIRWSHDEADGRRRHEFETTPRFATYVFSLIAGPYARVGREHDGVHLGLYGRSSMQRELERSMDELFEVTVAGMDHFEQLFGCEYPFTKYDQLFVPEFNAGAMENVGAVTFHDSFLFRDRPTYGQRLIRGEVILHELAHMWFGNLVTMRWWDDLWLNETFATYLSYRCLADATRFTDAWQVFNGQMRPAAYRQDQLSTTHPIAADVRHTDEAVANFDAITYEKGAAVIKQLVAALGDEAFRAGLRVYFERHSWGNATLGDLLAALADAAERPLDTWAQAWLRTASLNTIGARWTDRDDRIDSMELWQEAPQRHATLRPHATTVGLVTEDAHGTGLSVKSVQVHIDGARTAVTDAIGTPTPRFVYPNHGDHDYALASLDAISLAFALQRLPELPEPLLRQQVWSTLWQMVRDASLSSLAFLGAVQRFAPAEDDLGLVQAILDRAVASLHRYVPGSSAPAASSAFVATALDAVQQTDDQDQRIVWARAAIAVASADDDLERLLGLADGAWSVDGFAPDQEMRWSLSVKAMAHGHEDAEERLAAEAERDPSDRGGRAMLRAQASRPHEPSKHETWERINGVGYGSDYLTRAAMAGFQWHHQRALTEPFRERFFERIREVYRGRDHVFAQSYVRWLVPDLWAEPVVLERLRAEAAGLGDEFGSLRRQLDEIGDDLERVIRVRAYAETSPQV